MSSPPRTLSQPATAAQMMPLVYTALRRLAARKLTREQSAQKLEPAALVHEVYMRLASDGPPQGWQNRSQFFSAAAVVMQRILIERARRSLSQKRGGHLRRVDIDTAQASCQLQRPELLDLGEALQNLEQRAARPAQIVRLRYFSGLTIQQAARELGVSVATVKKDWAYARSWLRQQLDASETQAR